MTRGKLFVIEGTDASGKATQTEKLLERLAREGIPAESISFPRYDTPTGRIVAGPYLGKEGYGPSYFEEGAALVHPEIASLFFAADRRAARDEMLKILESGRHLVLDRYVSSNMAHQGGKIESPEERKKLLDFLESLEYGLLRLPRPDGTAMLYVPTDITMTLIKKRGSSDGHESSQNHLTSSEKTYMEIVSRHQGKWYVIECTRDGKMRTREEIHEEVFGSFKRVLNQ